MSSQLILYGFHGSPPVRAVLLTLHALDLPYEFHEIQIQRGEHRTPEFHRKNPQHSLPTLEDDGRYLWDSHAIMAYLVGKFGRDGGHSLYPKDLYQRAVVDQRLHYENGVIFWNCFKRSITPLFRGKPSLREIEERRQEIREVYASLEVLFGDNQYIAGPHLTIADFSIVSTVSSLVTFAPIVKEEFGLLFAWLERMRQLSFYAEANGKAADALGEMITARLAELTD